MAKRKTQRRSYKRKTQRKTYKRKTNSKKTRGKKRQMRGGIGDQHIIRNGVWYRDKKDAGCATGSNPGGLFRLNSPTGQLYYVKGGESEDNVKNEVLTAEFYRRAGIPISDMKLIHPCPEDYRYRGMICLGSAIIDARNGSIGELRKARHVQRGFAMDAWVGNWDVIGLANDNILITPDNIGVRIDVGGALRYRATGPLKGDGFSNEVNELNWFGPPNPTAGGGAGLNAARVFGVMSINDVVRSAEQTVLRFSDQDIERIVRSIYDEDYEEHIRNELISKLVARREYIRRYVEQHKPRQRCRSPSVQPRRQQSWGDAFRSLRTNASQLLSTYGPAAATAAAGAAGAYYLSQQQ